MEDNRPCRTGGCRTHAIICIRLNVFTSRLSCDFLRGRIHNSENQRNQVLVLQTRGIAMSGHSKWATIKHKKGALNAKRGKIFTRLTNESALATHYVADPVMTPRLSPALLTDKYAK